MSRGGDLIYEARRRARLTQAELAERVGTTQSAVARWERGGAAPSLDTTLRILRTIGFDLDYMLVPYDDSDYAQARSMLRRSQEERERQLLRMVTVARELRTAGQAT